MGEKDISEKLLEDYTDVFADIINVLTFQGERLLEPSNLVDGPTVSRYKSTEAKPKEQIRDVVKFDNRQTKMVVFGIENQSIVDPYMVFRVMGYDFSSYKRQMDEGKSRISPVITLVLNFGMKHWSGPKDVLSAVDQDLPYRKYLEAAMSNPRINVVDVAFLSKEVREQFISDFRIVAEYFSAVREGRLEEIRFSRQKISHVEEILDFFKIFGKDQRFEECKPVILEEAKKGDVTMCVVMDYAENCGRKQGLKQGLEQGREEGLEQGREEGIKGTVLILKNLNTPVPVIREQLMKAYGLSDNEVQKYLK